MWSIITYNIYRCIVIPTVMYIVLNIRDIGERAGPYDKESMKSDYQRLLFFVYYNLYTNLSMFSYFLLYSGDNKSN